MYLFCLKINVDPGQQNPCAVAAMDKFTRTTESCGGKGTARTLSQEKSTSEHLGHSLKGRAPQALPGQAFIAFLGILH